MEYKINKKSELTQELKITINAEEWKKAVERVYEQQKGKYSLEGWRKGKVPQKIIEKNYGNTIFWEDAITEVANDGFKKAINENKDFDPVGTPNLNVDKVDDKGLELTITTEVIPPVKLAKYTGIEIEAPIRKYNEKMLEEELKHAQIHKTTDKPAKDKVSEKGDIVVIDFVGSVDGVEFEGGKAEDHKLELGSKTFIDNFEDQLVGHKAGDKVDVNVTFPKDYGAKNLAGKKALFKCEIKSVNTKIVPEINDDFAKSMGDYKNLEEYKKDVEAQIKYEIEGENKRAEEDAILQKIIKESTVTLPPVLVKENLDNIMKDLEYRLMYQGLNLEDYAKYTNTTVEKLRQDRTKDAENLTKTKLVLEALVKAENLRVEESDANAKFEEIAKIQNKSIEEVKKDLNPNAIDRMYSDILMDKLVAFLKSRNTIKPIELKEEKHCHCGDDCHCDDECDCDDDCDCGDENCDCKKNGKKIK